MALIFLWIFVEALLLSAIGTTFGKWLLKITVTHSSGLPISYSEAISRCFKVWWRGMAAAIPFVNIFTMASAEKRLRTKGVTTWDEEGGFLIAHENIGILRVTITTILSLIIFFLAAAASSSH